MKVFSQVALDACRIRAYSTSPVSGSVSSTASEISAVRRSSDPPKAGTGENDRLKIKRWFKESK